MNSIKKVLIGEDSLSEAISRARQTLHFIHVETRIYPDGELCPRLLLTSKEEVKDKDVVVVSQPQEGEGLNNYLIRFFLTLHNVKSLNPASITVIMTYYAYARQDDKFRLGEPLSSMFVSQTIENCKADQIFVISPHFDPKKNIKTFFPTIKATVVSGMKILGQYLAHKGNYSKYIITAPDEGARGYAEELAKEVGASEIIAFSKSRDRDTGEITQTIPSTVDVKDRHFIIVDDIVSSGGTMINAAKMLYENGAKGVGFAYVHALHKSEAVNQMLGINPEFILTTDTIENNDNRLEIASIVDDLLERVF